MRIQCTISSVKTNAMKKRLGTLTSFNVMCFNLLDKIFLSVRVHLNYVHNQEGSTRSNVCNQYDLFRVF